MTPSRGVTPDLKLFFWLNLERTLDKNDVGRWECMVRRRELKKVVTFRGDD